MNWVIVRGAGDIATGTILRLKRCGFSVAALESPRPTTIRRNVALSQAVYTGGEVAVEDVTARLVSSLPERETDFVPLLIDPDCEILKAVRPAALVDGILAKKNLGTTIDMAPATVGLGPGFTAGRDVRAVVETKRGHALGRVIWNGTAIPNTGVPGVVGGVGKERVIHAPAEGTLHILRDIGSRVEKDEPVATIDGVFVYAAIPGLVRGMLPEGFPVTAGMKMADVDPRLDTDWHTVSDKALAVAGGVVEALMKMGVRP
ncbi:MAG: EF2563 family selenium-dependent molybdenum hydroxylase system protein [Oscillospiraceae bacterium]|nr:EF2563 family selenium-dependent molybdenum hydroxylase system protein [Oscillospiraceae bacterium]